MAVNVVKKIDNWVKVNRVLLSVSDKSGLDELVPALIEINPDIHFYSTGGTYAAIGKILGEEKATKHLTQVSDYTGQPETQGGLVKTLDFKIYLGILTETYNESHQEDLKRTDAYALDMVVVNLYPFKDTVAKEGVTVEMARANIDIGGPTMVRASAKNYHRVASVVNPSDYAGIIEQLKGNDGKLNLAMRFALTQKAFAHTAEYDSNISAYLSKQNPEDLGNIYDLQK